MLVVDREEFDRLLGLLLVAFNLPLTADRGEAYWLGLQRMHLPVFRRTVEFVLGEDGPEGVRPPTPRQLWQFSKKLPRASARTAHAHAPEESWTGDKWDEAANRHLLAYLVRGALKKTASYDRRQAAILVDAKREWAKNMRSLATGNGVDLPTQRGAWDYQMGIAEEQIQACLLMDP
jgi:hypothetical protein